MPPGTVFNMEVLASNSFKISKHLEFLYTLNSLATILNQSYPPAFTCSGIHDDGDRHYQHQHFSATSHTLPLLDFLNRKKTQDHSVVGVPFLIPRNSICACVDRFLIIGVQYMCVISSSMRIFVVYLYTPKLIALKHPDVWDVARWGMAIRSSSVASVLRKPRTQIAYHPSPGSFLILRRTQGGVNGKMEHYTHQPVHLRCKLCSSPRFGILATIMMIIISGNCFNTCILAKCPTRDRRYSFTYIVNAYKFFRLRKVCS